MILLLLPFWGTAQQKPSERNKENSLLWQISGNGLKDPSFLFGSYHLIGKDFLDTLPGIGRSYAKASAVAGEVLIGTPMEMAQKMMPFMLLKNNTLDKIFTPREFAEVDSFFKEKTGMSVAMLNGMKPSVVQVTLVAELAQKTISDTNPALDQYFQEQGKKDKKEIIGLETLESQAKILFEAPLERQKVQLLEMIRENEKSEKENKDAFQFYKTQNLEKLAKAMFETEDYTAEEMDLMVNNRNRNWVAQLPAIMDKQSTFIVVGAGHLVGPRGLINLLKKAGYVVIPVPTK